MKIVGVMLARNEDWVIGASARVALEWVDTLFVLMHACTDRTWPILREIQNEYGRDRLIAQGVGKTAHWEEMDLRQKTLVAARELGATHVAIIDADEVPTTNIVTRLRGWVGSLAPRQLLDIPMIAPWRGLGEYRDDTSVWCTARITTAFGDDPSLCWRAADDGYQFHARAPRGTMHGASDRVNPLADKSEGGIMHLQWVDWDRLLTKHVLYRAVERIRWPNRDTVEKVNWRYDLALDERKIKLSKIPDGWVTDLVRRNVFQGRTPWHRAELDAMISKYPREAFSGLDLKGLA